MKKAVFPGSFDPITNGHIDVIQKALPLFDKIIIAIGTNTTKNYMFDISRRKAWIEDVFKGEQKIEVQTYQSLTVDFCRENGASFILRGLRSTLDFEYEKPIAYLNHELNSEVETVFFLASQNFSSVSSTIIREIIRYGGDVTKLVPSQVLK